MKKKFSYAVPILFVLALGYLFVPPEVLPVIKTNPSEKIDYSCKFDADCEIKNVGNMCGYYPLCVNKDFEPNPPGLSSNICGWPVLEGCTCVQSKCTGVAK